MGQGSKRVLSPKHNKQVLVRLVRRNDLPSCVELAEDRFLYADCEIEDLTRMWLELVDAGVAYANIVEDEISGTPLAFGISAFINDAVAAEYQSYSRCLIGRELFDDWRRGESTLLGETEIARDNATGGVNIVVLANGWKHGDPTRRQNAGMKLAEGFSNTHLGLNARTLTCEWFGDFALPPEFIGFEVVQPKAACEGLARAPILLRASRENMEIKNFALGQLFFGSKRPRFYLNAKARRVLVLALDGLSDNEIADELGISPDGLKKRWLHIFETVRSREPSFFGSRGEPKQDGKRGEELRATLLTYVRRNREELHPCEEQRMPAIQG